LGGMADAARYLIVDEKIRYCVIVMAAGMALYDMQTVMFNVPAAIVTASLQIDGSRNALFTKAPCSS